MKTPPKFYALEKTGDNEATITIYDEIGAYGAGSKEFLSDLGKLDGQHIHLRINSPGGSVVEGTAIYNALRRHKGGLTVHIDALAASMASVIAMAGSPTYIADNALLMIHNPWTISMGDSEQLRREADLLDKLKKNLVNAYTRKTGISEEEVQQMMDNETWLDAVEAVALGFADAIEEGVAAAASATPEQLRLRFDSFAKGMTNEAQEAVPPEAVEETAVQETAPVAEETQAEQPAVEQPTEEPAPVVEEPQAKTDASAIVTKYNELSARHETLSALVEIIKGELSAKAESLERLERSLGLQAARVVPVIEQDSAPSSDPVAEYLAAVESGDKQTAAALFAKHKALIFAHRNQVSKA